jgi:hypothetical protein
LPFHDANSALELLDFVPLPRVWGAMKAFLDGVRRPTHKAKPPAARRSPEVDGQVALQPTLQVGDRKRSFVRSNDSGAAHDWLKTLDGIFASLPQPAADSRTDTSDLGLSSSGDSAPNGKPAPQTGEPGSPHEESSGNEIVSHQN